ncbi:DUF2933 domain-containing protein [Ramlibacter sp. AN1015]|uniref:DUF2933 domain-containing protein n=1 Tax=Ramlibacter sp. AN1015 TaxID=3133428 RepID=UPI0030C4ECC8
MAHGAHTTSGPQTARSFWRSPFGVAVTVLAVLASIYLYLPHQDHGNALLPYLVVATCPLMHVFMHRGHGHGHGHHQEAGDDQQSRRVQGEPESRQG